jgi:5-methylcytosine-specific restriction protein A
MTRRRSLRKQVERRDLGVCAQCGLDTHKLWRILSGLNNAKSPHGRARFIKIGTQFSWAVRWDLVGDHEVRWTVWEADHIRAICDGGPDTLRNLRTLCIPCHREATKALLQRVFASERPQL